MREQADDERKLRNTEEGISWTFNQASTNTMPEDWSNGKLLEKSDGWRFQYRGEKLNSDGVVLRG